MDILRLNRSISSSLFALILEPRCGCLVPLAMTNNVLGYIRKSLSLCAPIRIYERTLNPNPKHDLKTLKDTSNGFSVIRSFATTRYPLPVPSLKTGKSRITSLIGVPGSLLLRCLACITRDSARPRLWRKQDFQGESALGLAARKTCCNDSGDEEQMLQLPSY